MKSKLSVLKKIDACFDRLLIIWDHASVIVSDENGSEKGPVVFLGALIKLLHYLISNEIFDINAIEHNKNEKNFNTELLSTSFFTICPNDAYKEFIAYQTQLSTNGVNVNLTEKHRKEEKASIACLQSIYKKINLLSASRNNCFILMVHPETLQRLTVILPKQELIWAAKNIFNHLFEREYPGPGRWAVISPFVKQITDTIATIAEFNDFTKNSMRQIVEFRSLVDKAGQLIKNPEDLIVLLEKNIHIRLHHHLTLSPNVIDSISLSINSADEFLTYVKKQPLSATVLARDIAFSYRIFIELNLSAEQFFALKNYHPVSINPISLSTNHPAIIKKINSYIQDIAIFKKLLSTKKPILLKIAENPNEAVILFNRIFANNLNELFEMFESLAMMREHGELLNWLISHNENRKTLAKSITHRQLCYLLFRNPSFDKADPHQAETKYLVLSTEDETSQIVKNIYPNITIFMLDMWSVNYERVDLWAFIFKHETSRQYLASLFKNAEQLLEFTRVNRSYEIHPSHSIASIIFAKLPQRFFTDSPTIHDQMLNRFPQHRLEIAAEKIQEAIPDAIRITKTIIAGYLFFAPPKPAKPLDLDMKDSKQTHTLTKQKS